MVEVNLLYNAYQNSMKILADGQPLSNISSLTRYQTMPFLTWCGEILPKIAEEVNDEYALTYTGRSCESRVFAALSAQYSVCRSFKPKEPTLADSTTKRLRKLHQRCVSGLAYTQFSETLKVYSDLESEAVQQLFKAVLPKLCFCRIRIELAALSELANSEKEMLRFVVADEANAADVLRTAQALKGESYAVFLSQTNEFLGVYNSCVAEKATEPALYNVVGQYLELSFYVQLLRKALSAVAMDAKDVNYSSVVALDKIEPQTFAVIPTSIECNQSIPIKLYTVPEGYETRQIIYRISNEEIVHIRDNTMYCTGTGEVVIEVYEAGQSLCISRSRVVAHKRNRITSLTLAPAKLRLSVGDKVRLKTSYEPQDADNTSTIRIRSDDGLIASAIEGLVTARKPGFTKIQATTDSGVTASCDVEVFPKLEDITLTLSETRLAHNGIAKVTAERCPRDATLDDLVFSVEPPSVAVFDKAGMKLAARGAGKGKLVVTDKRKSVKKEVEFDVAAEKPNFAPAIKWIAGILLVLALIYLFTR